MTFHGFNFFLVSQFRNLVYETPSQPCHEVVPQLKLRRRTGPGYQQGGVTFVTNAILDIKQADLRVGPQTISIIHQDAVSLATVGKPDVFVASEIGGFHPVMLICSSQSLQQVALPAPLVAP